MKLRNNLLTRVLKLYVATAKVKQKTQCHLEKELRKPDKFAYNSRLGVLLTTFLDQASRFVNVLYQIPHNLQGRSVRRESDVADDLIDEVTAAQGYCKHSAPRCFSPVQPEKIRH